MWHWLNRFEGVLFLIPFLIYALLSHTYYSIRCVNCGRRLFNYENCHQGLCDQCMRRELIANLGGHQSERAAKAVSTANYGEGHIYKTVVRRAGQGRVLDVGCGWGTSLTMLNPQGRELHGLDITHEALSRAKEQNDNISFYVGNANELPFKSDMFDCLICTETLEHIEGDNAVRECYRVLKPNGVALFTVPNGSGISGRVADHVRMFSFQDFSHFLQQAGFDVVSGRKFGLYIPLLSCLFRTLSAVLRKDLPFSHPLNISVPECLATHFFIECRQPAHPRKEEQRLGQIENKVSIR